MNGISIRPMSETDVPEVIHLMASTPEVAFCWWEDEALLRREVSRPGGVHLVARAGRRVVGALIGGSFGVRGTISHLAVAPPFRRTGVGQELVAAAYAAFQSMGIHRLFLFVHVSNAAGVGFWKSLGFSPVSGETTLEYDLPAEEVLTGSPVAGRGSSSSES
jgi:ribosomal protein S18 acetylase RimI-like enzyme